MHVLVDGCRWLAVVAVIVYFRGLFVVHVFVVAVVVLMLLFLMCCCVSVVCDVVVLVTVRVDCWNLFVFGS